MFEQLLLQAQSGEMPTSRETVTDCLLHSFAALVQAWVSGVEPLASELDALALALTNPDDPYVTGMNPIIRQQVNLNLEKLVELRETAKCQSAPMQESSNPSLPTPTS